MEFNEKYFSRGVKSSYETGKVLEIKYFNNTVTESNCEQFLLFPQCFKSCLLLMCQNEYLWSKGLNMKKL